MTISHLAPGDIYKLSSGIRVKYIGANRGLNLDRDGARTVKVSRSNITARLVEEDWLRGACDQLGCAVLAKKNGALWATGADGDLRKLLKVIETTHGFFPSMTVSAMCDGNLQVEYGPFPRIEIHPSMVAPRAAKGLPIA